MALCSITAPCEGRKVLQGKRAVRCCRPHGSRKGEMMKGKDDPRLIPRDGWQTRQRGTLQDEYDIYRGIVTGAGDTPKSFDEWLNS